MKKSFLFLTLLLGFIISSSAQTFKLVGLNTLYGAATGTGLGGATLLLTDSKDLGAIRVGFGAGTLVGLGLGVYDVSNAHGLIQGYFSSAEVTSQIVAMDTFYGAGTGALVGFAISLIANNDIIGGIKIGTGVGAWTGFAFGVVETLFLSSTSGAGGYGVASAYNYQSVNGLVQIQDAHYNIGFISPTITNQWNHSGAITSNPTLTVAHLKISL